MGSILLVEADPTICDVWTGALSAMGHAVYAVSTAREALPAVRDGGIDCVVIDSYDPRIGIVELARSIEALPDAPPVILVSGSPHAPEISARIGAVAFVAAPVEPSELANVVARVVGNSRPVLALEDEPTSPNHTLG
ncbi:MAG TPA: response regulator [Kofleriaceae bacterium]